MVTSLNLLDGDLVMVPQVQKGLPLWLYLIRRRVQWGSPCWELITYNIHRQEPIVNNSIPRAMPHPILYINMSSCFSPCIRKYASLPLTSHEDAKEAVPSVRSTALTLSQLSTCPIPAFTGSPRACVLRLSCMCYDLKCPGYF